MRILAIKSWILESDDYSFIFSFLIIHWTSLDIGHLQQSPCSFGAVYYWTIMLIMANSSSIIIAKWSRICMGKDGDVVTLRNILIWQRLITYVVRAASGDADLQQQCVNRLNHNEEWHSISSPMATACWMLCSYIQSIGCGLYCNHLLENICPFWMTAHVRVLDVGEGF